MTMDELRNIQRASPFQPFRVRMADGRSFEIKHPEFMYVPPGRNARTFVLTSDEGLMEWFNILLVTSVEQMNGRKRSGGSNGQKKK